MIGRQELRISIGSSLQLNLCVRDDVGPVVVTAMVTPTKTHRNVAFAIAEPPRDSVRVERRTRAMEGALWISRACFELADAQLTRVESFLQGCGLCLPTGEPAHAAVAAGGAQ